eukprot:scaffold253494_cov19-Tisochrysis_lutea.AAC.1
MHNIFQNVYLQFWLLQPPIFLKGHCSGLTAVTNTGKMQLLTHALLPMGWPVSLRTSTISAAPTDGLQMAAD